MKEWKEKHFNDFVKLNRGFDLPNEKIIGGKYPVVASTNIKAYHNEYKVKPPGVVTGRSGSLGVVQYVNENFWPLNTALYVKDFKGNYPKFVYYYLQIMHLENFNAGAGIPSLNQNHLHKVKIKVPSLSIQQRIANILSTYDDLIETNNQRIKLLEETAQQLYKEWFVRMRFPDFKKVKFVKGVPEGWTTIAISDVVDFKMGQSPLSEFYNEEGIGLPFHQGVGTYGERFPNHKIHCSVSGRTANKGDILFSVRAPVGRLNIADRELIIGRGLAALRHKKALNYYLFYLLQHEFSEEDLIGNGSIFNSVGKDELRNYKIFDVGNLANKFNDLVQPFDEQISILLQQNTHLRQIRDRLLPRLISGKLAVKSDKNDQNKG